MKIIVATATQRLSATIDDSPAGREFLSRLPLTLTLKDYAGIEKIAYLDNKLSVDNAPDGHKAAAGDITYYAPWGNLAIFGKKFGYASGLVKLGAFDGDYAALFAADNVDVVISVA